MLILAKKLQKNHMQGKDFKCYPHIIYKITSQIIPSHTMIKKKKVTKYLVITPCRWPWARHCESYRNV